MLASGNDIVRVAVLHVLGVAVDAAGVVFAADALNHCIRSVTPLGLVSTLAGSGSQGAANDNRHHHPSDNLGGCSGHIVVAIYVGGKANAATSAAGTRGAGASTL